MDPDVEIYLPIILGVLVSLVIDYFVGKEFERIAAMKGFVNRKYFWWTFLVTPVGMLMVIALPDRSDKMETAQIPSDELPDL